MKNLLTVFCILFSSHLFAQGIQIVYGDAKYMTPKKSATDAGTLKQEYLMKANAPDGAYVIFSDKEKTKICQRGYLKNGHPVKVWNYYYDNQSMKSSFEYDDNGMLINTMKEYYESGNLKTETQVRNGIPNGMAATFNEKGKKTSYCNYVNGIKEGTAVWFDESGASIKTMLYKNGTAVSETFKK
jgi:antitoxin component YwqK of YwqJK toxin-antitoxin module